MEKINNEMNKRNSLWKIQSGKYLFELQKFFDRVSNIEDEKFREDIITQMLKCDRELTKLSEEIFEQKNRNIKRYKYKKRKKRENNTNT